MSEPVLNPNLTEEGMRKIDATILSLSEEIKTLERGELYEFISTPLECAQQILKVLAGSQPGTERARATRLLLGQLKAFGVIAERLEELGP